MLSVPSVVQTQRLGMANSITTEGTEDTEKRRLEVEFLVSVRVSPRVCLGAALLLQADWCRSEYDLLPLVTFSLP